MAGSRVKILPSDFISEDAVQSTYASFGGGGAVVNSSTQHVATFIIPLGYKATHVKAFGGGTDSMDVRECSISSSVATLKGSGNVGTEIDITDVTATETNYLSIRVAFTNVQGDFRFVQENFHFSCSGRFSQTGASARYYFAGNELCQIVF